jgi:hypothetical protein
MEREDDTTGRRSDGVSPAGPSQPDDGFAEGVQDEGDRDDTERVPDFARGIDQPHDDPDKAEGRYSRGAEAEGTEEASKEGRFSEGIEQLPHERK